MIGPLDLADDRWFAIAVGRPRDDADTDPEAVVRAMIGADVPVEVLGTDRWQARSMVAQRYRAGRAFLVGDAAHQNPPWGGHGYNTGVGDAVNLGWKLAAVVNGWAPDALLDSYGSERRPVAEQTIAVAETNTRVLPGDEALRAADAGGAARAGLARAVQGAKRSDFFCLGLVLGYGYGPGADEVMDADRVADYTPRAAPGLRLPHRWLAPGLSLYDRLGRELTVLGRRDLAAPLVETARERGVPLTVVDDLDEETTAHVGAPLVLVRPDQHVAWLGTGLTQEQAAEVLDAAVRGFARAWFPPERPRSAGYVCDEGCSGFSRFCVVGAPRRETIGGRPAVCGFCRLHVYIGGCRPSVTASTRTCAQRSPAWWPTAWPPPAAQRWSSPPGPGRPGPPGRRRARAPPDRRGRPRRRRRPGRPRRARSPARQPARRAGQARPGRRRARHERSTDPPGGPPMTTTVRPHPSGQRLPREEQLAHRLAVMALDDVPVREDVAEMVVNRVVDDAAVAAASLLRDPVVAARAQALAHPPSGSAGGAARTHRGATVTGEPASTRVAPEWAAWANGVAVRELDFHDTFLAAEYSHPGDNIPPLLAVAQHVGADGASLVRGIVAAYEVQVDLVRGISLHAHKIDHVAHLGPSVAAGIGAMLRLDVDTVFHAVGQALHTTTATRQSRKGEISSWKAYAPAFAGKAAIEAVDRAMRGQGSPTPIYEGEDGVIAQLLDGPDAVYEVPLPEPGEAKEAILLTYTKEHSAEYQAQAWIDLARRLGRERPELKDPSAVESIVLHTSHHTHAVIGSGANDPQKYDPTASRETLDHSIPYILAVALQDGGWDHVTSYAPQRAARPDTVALWQKITTREDPIWTRRYHSADPAEKAFGGRLEAVMTDGSTITAEIAVADAHPLGARPFSREQYVAKLRSLADGVLDGDEVERFLGVAQRLPSLGADELDGLTIVAPPGYLGSAPMPGGLF